MPSYERMLHLLRATLTEIEVATLLPHREVVLPS